MLAQTSRAQGGSLIRSANQNALFISRVLLADQCVCVVRGPAALSRVLPVTAEVHGGVRTENSAHRLLSKTFQISIKKKLNTS